MRTAWFAGRPWGSWQFTHDMTPSLRRCAFGSDVNEALTSAVAGRAERVRVGLQERLLAEARLVDGVAGEAIHRLGRRVHAVPEGRALRGLLVAGQARVGAGPAMEGLDEGLVALGLHVLRPVAVARLTDRVRPGARVGGEVATGVWIRREDLGLVVAVGARGPGLHLRGSRLGWRLGHHRPRRENGEGGGGEGSEREVFHRPHSVNARGPDRRRRSAPAPWHVPHASAGTVGALGEVRRVHVGVGGDVAAVVAARAGRRGRAARREVVARRDDRDVRDRERERVRRRGDAWHARQFRRSPGYVTSLKVDVAPPKP